MVVVSDIDTLGATLQDFLDVAVAALALTDKGPPALQYVADGLPALDRCDLVCTYLAGMGEEMTQPISPIPATGRRYARGRVNLPGFVVLVARCRTNLQGGDANYREPSAAQLTADGLAHAQDGWALWNGFTQAFRDGTLLGGRCDDIHFDQLLPLEPQGGVNGWTLHIRADLPGIPE